MNICLGYKLTIGSGKIISQLNHIVGAEVPLVAIAYRHINKEGERMNLNF
jgi:hypothetical protein